MNRQSNTPAVEPICPVHLGSGKVHFAQGMKAGTLGFRIGVVETIGTAVSSGCIPMLNEDVVDLYDRVKVGTRGEEV
jgi:L,D-transpeptidase catalytic domain